jgi:signal transduction histidine kinase/CheY-like chemotaxis protein/HPt (histidine-containing phosphotransfer) domain-containing protein
MVAVEAGVLGERAQEVSAWLARFGARVDRAPDDAAWPELVAALHGLLTPESRERSEIASSILALIESFPYGLLVETENRFVRFVNPGFCTMFGIPSPEAILGADCEILGQQSAPYFVEGAGFLERVHAIITERTYVRAEEIRMVDGRTLARDYIPVFDGDRFVGHMWFYRDVTARVEREKALADARKTAEAASAAKTGFLANMSHELRTPLNGVLGMAQLLADTRLTEEQRRFVGAIQASGEALLAIIGDVLDTTRIEAGKMPVDMRPTDIVATVEEAVTALALKTEARGVELVCDLLPGLPPQVVIDQLRFRQIVTNLLGNATKFTTEGFIEVRVGAMPLDEPGRVMLELVVEDSGVGIPASRLDAVFESFTQAEAGTARKHGGTGLGLTITRQLVELLGGTIRVASTPGVGSTFTVQIPVAVAGGSSAGDGRRLAGLSSVIVSPVDRVRRAAKHVGESVGLSTDVVEDLAALGQLLEARSHGASRPDVVLIDERLCHALPPADQCDALLRFLADVPRVAFLTPQAGSVADHSPLTQRRLVHNVPRPLTHSALRRLANAARRSSGEFSKPGVAANGRAAMPRVLVVDDSTINREVAVAILSQSAIAVEAVASGADALVALAEKGPYDVVLVDVQMPEMDGYELTRKIREQPQWAELRLVAMTAHAMPGDREACLAAGMNGYLTKPVRRDRLVECVLAEASEADGPAHPANGAAKGHATDAQTTAPAASLVAGPDVRLIDLEKLKAIVRGDDDLVRELIGLLLEDGQRVVNDLARLANAGDLPGVRKAAHFLAGSAGNLQAGELATLARTLESLVIEGVGVEQVRLAGRGLNDAWARLRPHLERIHAGASVTVAPAPPAPGPASGPAHTGDWSV